MNKFTEITSFCYEETDFECIWVHNKLKNLALRCCNSNLGPYVTKVSFHKAVENTFLIGRLAFGVLAKAEFSPVLIKLAVACLCPDPIIDWVLEHAETPEQKEIVKCLEMWVLND